MWEYNHTDNMYVGRYDNEEELYHYGVLGMRWGVRRASRNLSKANSSGDKEKRQKALDSLNKHQMKINKKLAKLDKRGVKLENKRTNALTKGEPKAAKLERKASKYRLKAAKYDIKAANAWTERGQVKNKLKAEKFARKEELLNAKASQLKSKSQLIEAKINKNEELKRIFNQGLSTVNEELVKNAKKHVKKRK